MTHVMVGPDLTPRPCTCDAEIDHGQPLACDSCSPEQSECRNCQAILDEDGRCYYCDASWIWSTP